MRCKGPSRSFLERGDEERCHRARARALADGGLRELPDSPGVRYALALAAAGGGDDEAARRWLAEAVERIPELADEARKDAVLARLLDARD